VPLPAQGVMEEVGLIKWPAPVKAVLNTLLVILIVAGTSGLLLGINTLLTELSNAVY
jgi:preprotein translocase subunit SecE